jgi:hypothetical protein
MAEDFTSQSTSDGYHEQSTLSIGRRQMWRAISAAALGNAVEWYDAAVYLYIAGTIGKVFFSQERASVQLINSFDDKRCSLSLSFSWELQPLELDLSRATL